jgi:hypothetical protein
MTNKRSTINRHEINSADVRRRRIRLAQVAFAGAATIATLTLSSAALSGNAGTVVAAPASGTGASSKVMTVDDNNNPSSGDIFTQNAQDQSTANGAGT